MAREAWFINPRKSRKRKSYKRNRRKGAYKMARRTKRRKRRSYRRRNPAATYMSNRPRRRRKRSYRRNPSRRRYARNPATFRQIGPELGWAAAGFAATKVTGNFVAPMLAGVGGENPMVRVGLKFGTAYLAAWVLEMFFGRRVFMPAFVGGSLEAIQDGIKTFIAPTFPMLSDYGSMGIYYEPPISLPSPNGAPGLGTYYEPSMGEYEVAT